MPVNKPGVPDDPRKPGPLPPSQPPSIPAAEEPPPDDGDGTIS